MFSDRMGITQPKSLVQKDDMDKELRVALWNVIHRDIHPVSMRNAFQFKSQMRGRTNLSILNDWFICIWTEFFKLPLDEMPSNIERYFINIKEYIYNKSWYQVYNLIEFLLGCLKNYVETIYDDVLVEINYVLERECSAYRVIEGEVVPISDDTEIKAVEESFSNPSTDSRNAMAKALECLAKKPEHDSAGAFRHAISAVELLANQLTGKNTLPISMKEIKDKVGMHSALSDGLSKIYGYSSDSVRHGEKEDRPIPYEEAKFLVVTCAAYINFLIAMSEQIKAE